MSGSDRFVASARIIALLTLASRILGFVRDAVCAFLFGTGALLDAYTIAFQIPNLTRRLFGEGALSAAFIPVFSDTFLQEGPERARRLAGSVAAMLTLVLLGVTLLGEIGLGVAYWLEPALALKLTALMLPYMLLVCLVGFLSGLLNALNRFAAPALAPSVLNVFIIGAAFVGYRGLHWRGLPLLYLMCASVLLAGLAQIALQAASLRAADFRPRLSLTWRDARVGGMLRMMVPMVIGMSAVQLNTLADSLIAYFVVAREGATSSLYLAQRLYQFPLGIFSLSLATAIFPLLAAKASAGDLTGLARALERGISMTLFIAIPAMVGLIALATPLTRAAFERGEFKASDTHHVACTLIAYSVALWAYASQHILVRGFYALKDSKTPVRISLCAIAMNLVLSVTLARTRLEEAGIALATAITAAVQNLWLSRSLNSKGLPMHWSAVWDSALRTLAASGVMALALWLLPHAFAKAGWHGNVVRLALLVTGGGLVFVLAARALKCRELGQIVGRGTT